MRAVNVLVKSIQRRIRAAAAARRRGGGGGGTRNIGHCSSFHFQSWEVSTDELE